MMKFLSLSIFLLLFSVRSSSQAVSAYTNCPDVNIAIARAGTNSNNTNPYYLYNVNTSTGAMTQVAGGPYKDPANPNQNLQLNGIGVSSLDGFIYGVTNDPTVTTTRFLRLDKNYGVTSLGTIPTPTSPTGSLGFINTAAGEMDRAGNYYFTALTANPGATPSGLVLDRLYLGKIANTNTAVAGGPVSVTYYEINYSGANCGNYISTFMSDPINSGLKDFSYNAYTNSFFAYETYKPTGATNFSAQLLELRQVTGGATITYQLICSSTVNTQTAETSGTLIDKNGRFLELFTDGSVGVLNTSAGGAYDGTITMIANNTVTGLPNPLRSDMGSCGQQSYPGPADNPITSCPNGNYIIARAGTNADVNNPYYIYTVNTTTGTPTFIGGPLVYPNNPSQTLQVNGVGLNTADGYFYGLAYEGTVNTARFVRFDISYGVTTFGNIAPPSSSTGVFGFVNSAAGDVDRSNNYYFTAFTANPGGSPTGLVMDKLYIGKISNISSLAAGTTPVAQYYEIDYSDVNCSDYITSTINDPNNSGLKDFVFDPFTNTFITYVTYKPAGATNFTGQVIELRPIAGSSPLRYKMYCTNVKNTHNAEVAGTLIDNTGNFLVLMTDGSIGKLQTSGSHQYTGVYQTLNNVTGLPNPLRGDMASCSGPTNAPLPINLRTFNVTGKDCVNTFKWTSENEVNFNRYELEQSMDNNNFVQVYVINANRANNGVANYQVTIPGANKTALYRLKMIDNDGKFTYSPILTVNNTCTGKSGFVITPNPVAGRTINLNWYGITANAPLDIVIFNSFGTAVSRMNKVVTAGNSTMSITIDNLPAGAYFIKAADTKTNTTYEARFIKQ